MSYGVNTNREAEILNRIGLLKSRTTKENGRIIAKLERELRKIRENRE